jgi:probable O-glycosylation ligase (exosortase A-associated)
MRGIALSVVFFSLLPFVFGRGRLFGYFVKGPFFGILIWFWVSLMYPQFLVWSSPFAIVPYALIVAVSTLISWLASDEPKLPPPGRVTALLVSLMVWISISALFAVGQPAAVYEAWLGAEKMFLMTVLAYTLTNSKERLDQLILASVLSIGLLGLRGGLGTLLTGAQVTGPGGMLSGNNELGDALAMFLPLLLYLRWQYRDTRFKWPLTAFAGLNILGVVFTYSRGANLALCATLVAVWWRSGRKLLLAVPVIAAAVCVLLLAPPKWTERMNTLRSPQTIQDGQARLYLWHLGYAMALKHPIFGGGFKWSFDPAEVARQLAGSGLHWPFPLGPADRLALLESFHMSPRSAEGELPPLLMPRAMHSIWFEQLSDLGFPGFLLFLGCGFSVLLDARWLTRQARGRPDFAWADRLGRMMQASLVGYAVGGSFGSIDLYDGFYLLVIIAAAARRIVAAEFAMPSVPIAAMPSPTLLQTPPAG